MITTIIIVSLAFYWLARETDWLRIRLPCGVNTPKTEQPKRRWQFLKYGDDCVMMRDRCYVKNCNCCHKDNRAFTWRIPARTVKIYGSTINFKEGCNLYRAKLLRDIVRAQNSQAIPKYKSLPNPRGFNYDDEGQIQILVDGRQVLASGNGNGDYKPGIIKGALKPYITKLRVGRHTVIGDFGEADRITAP